MKEALKNFLGRVPLQIWARRQLATYADPNIDIEGIQEHVFARVSATISDSALARDYNILACADLRDFRRRVPVLTYEDLRHYIERVMTGETEAMYAKHVKLLMFALSSGTTGPRKYLPINNKTVAELKRSWRWWGTHLYSDHPDLLDCPITQITSSGLSGKTAGGTPFGDLSGFLAEIQPWYVSKFYAVPSIANKVTDQLAKYYVFLRFALANRDLRIMMTASPATLLRIADLASDEQAALIKDFYDGGVGPPRIRSMIPKIVLERLAKPDRKTARLLENLADGQQFQPRFFWPNLKVLACWTGGTMTHYKPVLRDRFGEVSFRDVGLASSEAHATIPIADNVDEGLLNLYSNVYEFGDVDGDGEVYLPHQLEEGRTYSLIITGLNGLLRYQTHDQVICAGHLGRWPLLRFHNKGEYVCDLTGEKLSAYHVSRAVEQVCGSTGLRLGPFVMVPNESFPRRYTLLVEDGGVATNHLEEVFLPRLDIELGKANFVYQEHRQAEKLGPIDYQVLPAGAIRDWHAQRLAESGSSMEQYKPPCLVSNAKRYNLRVS